VVIICTEASLLWSVLVMHDTPLMIPVMIPQLGILAVGQSLIDEFFIGGAVVSFFFTLPYIASWVLSKRWRAWIFVALILCGIDFLFFVVFLGFGFGIFALPLLVFHIWIMLRLSRGVSAWTNLRDVGDEEIQAALEEISLDKQRKTFSEGDSAGQEDEGPPKTDAIEEEKNEKDRNAPVD